MPKGVRVSFDKSERKAPKRYDFTDLVKNVPTALFVNMVSRAGMPSAQASDLCAAFKALKG